MYDIINTERGERNPKRKEYIIMKKNKRTEMTITWKFIGEEEIYISKGYSAGLASLTCDPMVEIIEVKEA